MKLTVWTGRVEDVLSKLDSESFDACLCDPPYGLSFMGKSWDTFSAGDSPMRRRPETDAVNAGASRQGGRRPTCPTCGAGRIATAPNGEKRCRNCYSRWRS